jgi:hypothetical protein
MDNSKALPKGHIDPFELMAEIYKAMEGENETHPEHQKLNKQQFVEIV